MSRRSFRKALPVCPNCGMDSGKRFISDTSYNTYYFTDDAVMKHLGHWTGEDVKSNVSLNWLLDDECEIVKVEKGGDR